MASEGLMVRRKRIKVVEQLRDTLKSKILALDRNQDRIACRQST